MAGEMVVVVLVVALGAAAQAVTGIGLGLVSGAVLAAVLGRHDAVPLLSLLSFPTLVVVLIRNRTGIRWGSAALLAVPSLVLTPLWVRTLDLVDPRAVARVAGLVVMVLALGLGFKICLPTLRGRVGAVVASATASLLNVAAGVGSPPPALYAINAGWSPTQTRGTLQIYFLALGVVVLGTMGMPSGGAAVLVPTSLAVAAGTVAGVWLAPRLSRVWAERATLSLAALGGLVLCFS